MTDAPPSLRAQPAGPGGRHQIAERRSPLVAVVFCTCGWRHAETTRQNALARAAKLRAAVQRHRAAP